MVISEKKSKTGLQKFCDSFTYFRQFKLTLGAGEYSQTLNTIFLSNAKT